MADSFFKINRGLNLDPQSQFGSSDPSTGVDGDIYYNSVLGKFRIFQGGFWSNLTSGGSGGSSVWVANELPLPSGIKGATVTFINAQPDTSYVVFAQLCNTTDAFPQYQQVIVTAKTTAGFTATWSDATDSANYKLEFIVAPKVFMLAEIPITNSVSTQSFNLLIPQNGSSYGLIAAQQNLTDLNPQFQSVVVTNFAASNFTETWNAPTDSSNYSLAYTLNATSIVPIGSGVNSLNVTLPVNYNSTNYAVIATMINLVDPFPDFQPIITTLKAGSNFTVSWSINTDTSNYKLAYYAISFSS